MMVNLDEWYCRNDQLSGRVPGRAGNAFPALRSIDLRLVLITAHSCASHEYSKKIHNGINTVTTDNAMPQYWYNNAVAVARRAPPPLMPLAHEYTSSLSMSPSVTTSSSLYPFSAIT